MFLKFRYCRSLFQGSYIGFDKKVWSGLIFLTAAFYLVFKNISLKFDEIFTSFWIKNIALIISGTFHLCHSDFNDILEIAFSSLLSNWNPPLIGEDRLFLLFVTPKPPIFPPDCKLCYMYVLSLFSCPKVDTSLAKQRKIFYLALLIPLQGAK